MRSRRSRGLAAALVALALTASALAGCGGGTATSSPSPSVSSSASAKLTTYSNPQYGFALSFDPRFKTGTGATARRAGQPPRFDIAFADSQGARLGGKYIDGLRVSVFELGRALTPRGVKARAAAFRSIVKKLLATLPSARRALPVKFITINGTPGYQASYTFVLAGTPMRAVSYFLVKGQREYQLTAQASQKTWGSVRPLLRQAVDTFHVD